MGCKTIKHVSITPGCISCGSCEAICPEVFEVPNVARVKVTDGFDECADLIREAAEMCPVSVIKVDEEDRIL